MNAAGFRVPMTGDSATLAACNLQVLADYGLNLIWFFGWCSDHCNGALDVSAPIF
jgi:hypothetical protein